MGGANYIEFDWQRLLDLPEEAQSLSYILEPISFSVDGTDLRTLDQARAKRTRSQNWSADEKLAYLKAKVDALGTVKGKDQWEFVSQRLCERHGFRRSAKECEYQWGTLRKEFRAICDHEGLKGDHPTSKWVREPMRSKNKLLSLECYELIKTILEEQNKRSRSTNPVGVPGPSHADYSGNGSHALVEEDVDAKLFIEQLLGSIFIKKQVEDAVNSRFESLLTSCGSTVKHLADELLTSLAPPVNQLVEAAAIFHLKVLTLTDKFVFDEDDPIAALAPFVEKYIADALNSALEPVSSELKALELKELEVQTRRQAIEEKRKKLDLEEMEIEKERQRAGRLIQRTKRASGSMQHGQRRRKIPPLGGSSRHEKIDLVFE
ncbi:hypothetical protein KC19_3G217400 [Ceratodon purpureus]|uniref:Myb-like domain-containing protein n=1 Tax=Ceratodon purpureus TaxID=3225 RepID=A0A8T0IQ60_CERPU|nr:hypothetical protein KC19_3G217400 [Ceratodon purpureus]